LADQLIRTVWTQLVLDGVDRVAPAPGERGPKGTRVGDIVIADHSRWRVQDIDSERREAICKLLAGAHTLRRFRARAIERVEQAPRRRRTPSAGRP
jgi:hypothetical protein